MKVLTKLNCATAIAFLPFESRPAIEKKIGARAEEPKPAKKNPRKAIRYAINLFVSTNRDESRIIEINPAPLPPRLP